MLTKDDLDAFVEMRTKQGRGKADHPLDKPARPRGQMQAQGTQHRAPAVPGAKPQKSRQFG